jgi:hypothetical protein
MALAVLGLSGESFHEPFHASNSHVWPSCYCA